MANPMMYIAYNQESVNGPFDAIGIENFKKENSDQDFIVFQSKKPEKDIEYLKSIICNGKFLAQKEDRNMNMSIISNPDDKAVLLAMSDIPAIRGILKRYGLTGCSHCDYSDREIIDWIIYNRDKGNL